jgi:hypothetical protein
MQLRASNTLRSCFPRGKNTRRVTADPLWWRVPRGRRHVNSEIGRDTATQRNMPAGSAVGGRPDALVTGTLLHLAHIGALPAHGERSTPMSNRSLAHDIAKLPGILLQDLRVKEDQRTERLVLGAGGHVAVDGQVGQEPADLGRAHLGRKPHVMEPHVLTHPKGRRGMRGLRSFASLRMTRGCAGQGGDWPITLRRHSRE